MLSLSNLSYCIKVPGHTCFKICTLLLLHEYSDVSMKNQICGFICCGDP